MVEPPAQFGLSVTSVESFQVIAGCTPPAGRRGKKFRNRGSRFTTPAVEESLGSHGPLMNSPLGSSRPVTRYPLAAARLMWGGSWLAESTPIESMVKVVGRPLSIGAAPAAAVIAAVK